MNYFTLAKKGKVWLSNNAPDPLKYREVLVSLAELMEENDVPRVPAQVAHNIGIKEDIAEQGLKYLTTKGFTKETKPPKPSEKGETAKLRIRPIESLVAAELRTIESQKKYTRSEKGKVVHAKYEGGEKGKAKNVRYRQSRKGRLVHKAYRLRRRLKELTTFLIEHPEKEDEIRPYITDVETRLNNLKGD